MRIGIDWGGTKLEGVVMGPGSAILQRKRIATPQGDYAATLKAVVGLVRELEQAVGQGPLRVGVAHPGAFALPHQPGHPSVVLRDVLCGRDVRRRGS